jgi:hypothetical protein
MSLEINEIGIRLQVHDGGTDLPARQEEPVDFAGIDREELVGDCVRRVLKALKSMEDR